MTPNTIFDIPPYLEVYGHKISDAEVHGYENLSVAGILKYSSNIGADLIGQRLGASRFGYWVSRFGFGKPTGVSLPGEQAGVVRPVGELLGRVNVQPPVRPGGVGHADADGPGLRRNRRWWRPAETSDRRLTRRQEGL